MSAEQIIDEIGDEQGWNDASKLDLVLQYIDHQGNNDTFRDFLLDQQTVENGEL